jgi:hypothetical protein
VNGRASLTPFGLWGRTCRTVLNEIRRVLIVLSKLLVNGPFPPVPDYSRSYEKQCQGRCPKGDEAHHRTRSPTRSRGTISSKGLRFRLRWSTSRHFKVDADG